MDQRRVLVVESDYNFAEQIMRSLLPYGVVAHIVSDGTEGLQRAKSDQPDLILLCVELPNMSGYSICNKLKKNPELKTIPLIIMSSDATPDIFEQHKKLKTRAEDYLIKPFPMQELIEKISRLMDLGSSSGGAFDHQSTQELEDDGSVDSDLDTTSTDDQGLVEIDVTDDDLIEDNEEPVVEETTQLMVDNEISMATEAAFAALELPDEDATRRASPMEILLPSEAATTKGLETKGEPLTAPPVEALDLDLSNDEEIELDATAVNDFPGMETDLPLPPTPEFDSSDIPGAEEDDEALALDQDQGSSLRVPDEEPTVEPEEQVEPRRPDLPEVVTLAEAAQDLGPGPAEQALRQRINELERENRRLDGELQQALASGEGSGISRDRELLNLREVINKKEKEILDLRDDIHSKERQILDHKDKVRDLERKVRDMDEKLLGVEREMLSASERIEALQGDKEQTLKREQGVKDRLGEAKKEIDKAYSEIEAIKGKQAEALDELRGELAAKESEHEQALTELKDRHAGEVGRLRAERQQVQAQAEEQREQALEQADQLRNEQLAEAREQHAGELEQLRAEHAQALEQLRAEHAQALEQAAEAQAEALAAAERQQEQALEQAAEAQARALAEALRQQEQALEQAAEAQVAALAEAEEQKEQALEQADRLRNEQLAEAQEQHTGAVERLNDQHARALEAKEAEHAGEKEALRTEQRAELERLEQAYGGELDALRQQQEDRVTGMENRHRAQVEELEQQHEEQLQELKGQLDDREQKVGVLSGRLESTEEALDGTRQRAAGLEVELESTRERVSDLEQHVVEHERQAVAYQDQLMKAFTKIRSDEALADKAKRAMAVAITLLEEQKKVSAEDERSSDGDDERPRDHSV